jgi:polyisoprenoid-binding protein YceI
MKSRILLAAATLLFVPQAFAAWTLDGDESMISFVSVKAGDIAEAHWFTAIAGSMDDSGAASVVIQLASVDTLIPVRDERMREMLFQTDIFPTATLSTKIDLAEVSSIAAGRTRNMTIEVMLDLNGQQVVLTADVAVSHASNETYIVSSRKPIILNAASVDLVDGIEALREVAGLSTISKAVPVSFVLSFKPAENN